MLPKKLRHQNKDKKILEHLKAWLQSGAFKCFVAVLAATAVLALMFGAAIAPERYDLKVGAISHKTITASKDVVDEIATAARRDTAARAVEPTYHLAEGVTDEVMAELEAIIKELKGVQQYGATQLDEKGAEYNFKTEEVNFAKAMLTKVNLNEHQTRSLMYASDDAFSDMVQAVTTAVQNTLNTAIRDGQVNESIQTILQIVGFRVETDLLQNVVTPILRKSIKPNMVIEQEATEAAQQKARDEVEPVVYVQGQNIIRAGERVSLNQIEMLRALGLLDDNPIDIWMYAGALLTVLTGVGAMLILLGMMRHEVLNDLRKICVLMLVIITSVAVCIIAVKGLNAYIAPVALSAMLLTGLLGSTAAIAGSLCVTIIASALTAGGVSNYATDMVHLLLMGLVSSVAAARFLRRRPQRVRVVVCGLVVGAANFIVVLAIGLMTNNDLVTVGNNGLWTLVGGLICAMLTLGLQPLFEAAFNLSTQSKLLELTNPNHPLLKRLLIEAPGTYHHTLMVANLSEAAAEAIGANPLLTRAGAYFHDVGKLKRPMYFKENQQGENLHDKTDPYVSAAIVTAHTNDGLQLAQKYRLPQEIQKFITEHQGDTPVMYFYHKALQQAGGKPVDINDFRYDGNRPSSKESAIVMLADTVEAAVRALPDPTPKSIADLIERLVRGKLEDGQLSESPLTLSDIDKICDAFVNALNGAFHERIEYPAVNVPKRISAAVAAQEPEPQAQTEDPPEPAAVPEPEPKPEAEPAPAPEPEPEAEPEAQSVPEPEPQAEAETDDN